MTIQTSIRAFMAFAFLFTMALGCGPLDAVADDDSATSDDDDPTWAVTSITTLKTYGKSVDWRGDRVVTARPLWDGYYDLLVFDPDDPTAEQYLTHDAPGAPTKHNGNPAWHPSGETIVFTAQNEDAEGEDADFVAIPGKGVNCNLWLAAADGSAFHQLTFLETAFDGVATAVIHPQFSPDGSQLLWTERVGPLQGSLWGEWVLKVADLVIEEDGAYLTDERSYGPGEQDAFYESHDFDASGRRVLFTGNLEPGQPETSMDIHQLDLEDGELVRLTDSSAWDEHAHWSPDGHHIAWMSSQDLDLQWPADLGSHEWPDFLATELWVMDADGRDAQRLTWFNNPDHHHHRAERVIVSDTTWDPEGGRILALLAIADAAQGGTLTSELVMIELDAD